MSERKYAVPAAVSVESGSILIGDFMTASSKSGVALRVDQKSFARAQHAKLDGAVEITNGSIADLTGSLVEHGLPKDLVEDARRLAEAGNKPGALQMIRKWASANLRPTEIAAVLAMAQQMLARF